MPLGGQISRSEPPGGILWSPRVGFNYALREGGREQVRGGIGLFAGRTPYVWLSNQYGNTGIEFRRLSVGLNANNRIPFVAGFTRADKTRGIVGDAFLQFRKVDPSTQLVCRAAPPAGRPRGRHRVR